MSHAVACCAGGVFALLGGVSGGPLAAAAEPVITELRDDVPLLRDQTASVEARRLAADRLLAATNLTPVIDAIGEAVEPGSAATVMLAAVSRAVPPPAGLFPVLRARLGRALSEERPAILGAVGAYRTREAARLLLEYTDPVRAESVTDAAFEALVRISGREDLGRDRGAWSAWLSGAERLSDAAWTLELMDATARRSNRLAAENARAVSRLVEALGRNYLATPEHQRAEQLAALLSDEIAAVRRLGFDLATRELSATNRLGEPVARAAIALLRHADPDTRAGAAVLVNQLAPSDGEPAVAAALAVETSAVAATAMLEAASRWPSPDIVRPVQRWLRADGSARRAAAGAAWALARAGLLDAGDQESVLDAVRELKDAELTPAACALLAGLGTTDDRDRLVPVLKTGSVSVRHAAAAALVGDPAYLTPILDAALADPELFGAASRGLLLHRATEEGYLQFRELPASSPEARREWRGLLAGAMPAEDVLAAARSVSDAREREELLESLLHPTRMMSETSEPARHGAIVEGGIELARLRLAAGRTDGAIAALDAITPIAPQSLVATLVSLQTTALLALGRVELAELLDAPVSAWLDGLRLCGDRPRRDEVADAIERRFAGRLSADEQGELDRLRAPAEPKSGG